MARFVSKYEKYRFIARSPRMMVLADGQQQELVSNLMAQFSRVGITEEEVSLGASALSHRGLPHDRETEADYSPRSRISVFDSVEAQSLAGWTDEERELVEKALRESPHNGVHFLEVVKQPAPKPWPTYDSAETPQKIIEIAAAIGVSLEDVVAYELENASRAPVVNELLAALATDASEAKDDADVLIEA